MDRLVLLLHRDPAAGAQIAASTTGTGLKVIWAQDVRDAIAKLARERFDLLIVDSDLESPRALEFLAKARQKAPRVLRSALANALQASPANALQASPANALQASPANASSAPEAEALVNLAGVCAILRPPLDRDRLLALIEEYGRPGPALAAAPDGSQTEALKARIKELEQKLAKAERDLRTARNADAMLKESELDLAALKAHKAKTKLGAEMQIDYHAADLRNEISKALDAMLDSPSVTLPILPRIGLELQKMMKNPAVSFDKVAELIAMEASLSARILSICNSPMYAGVEPVRNLQQAVARLGVQAMRDVAQTAAAENIFKTGYKAMLDLMSRLWTHSLATAHINMLVSEALGIEGSQDFFVMGLLHDIGKTLIVSLIQQGFDSGLWNAKILTPKIALSLIQERHNALGAALIGKWQYPEPFPKVVELHDDVANIHRYDGSVIVTCYSNLLTRKLGYSLVADDPALLSNHDLAQALNLTPELREQIERSSGQLIDRIKASYI